MPRKMLSLRLNSLLNDKRLPSLQITNNSPSFFEENEHHEVQGIVGV